MIWVTIPTQSALLLKPLFLLLLLLLDIFDVQLHLAH